MQASPSAPPASPSLAQAAAQITDQAYDQSQQGQRNPSKIGSKLLEAVLKAQGRGFFDLPEIQSLRTVSKDVKAAVDAVAPFNGLQVSVEDFSVAASGCPHLLKSAEKLHVVGPSFGPADRAACDQFASEINPSLKFLNIAIENWSSEDSWGQIVADHLIPRLTALHELNFPGYSSYHELVGIFKFLITNANLVSLKKLSISAYGWFNAEIFAHALAAFSKLHLKIGGDYSNCGFNVVGNDLQYSGVAVTKEEDHFNADEMPDWPQLERLDIHAVYEQWFFNAVTGASWFKKLQKLRLSKIWFDKDSALSTIKNINKATQLEELVIGYRQDVSKSLFELCLPKLKKLEIVKEDPHYEGIEEVGYKPLNLKVKFPALEAFKFQRAYKYVDTMINFNAPPASPAFKAFFLEGPVEDVEKRVTLYTRWMPRLKAVALRFNTFEHLQHMLSVLQHAPAAVPLWPVLSTLSLSLNGSITRYEATAAQLVDFFKGLASVGAHFPLLNEFIFQYYASDDYGKAQTHLKSIQKPLFKAVKSGAWPNVKSVVFKEERWGCDEGDRLTVLEVESEKKFSFDEIMAMEESMLEDVEEAA